MDEFHALVDEQVRRAMEAGLFDNLPGAGKPLELEDLSAVPADLRASYILLKNAGVLPEELALKQELLRIEDLLAACESEGEREALRARRNSGALKLAFLLERRGLRPSMLQYHGALAAALGGGVSDASSAS
jgi:hypothetical protein